MEKVKINTRDNLTLEIPLEDFDKMEDFMIKNMIYDTGDTSPIDINEDYKIIKNIIDSLRCRSLIFDTDTNLHLMYYVCDRWVVPQWLIEAIEKELNSSKKLNSINTFIDNLNNDIYRCRNCYNGFNKYKNTPKSCKGHRLGVRSENPGVYICCGKSEPCMEGYHVIDTNDINLTLCRLKDLL
jgi:hypothetical protein